MQRYDGVAFPKELGIPDPLDFKVLKMEELMGTYQNVYRFTALDSHSRDCGQATSCHISHVNKLIH